MRHLVARAFIVSAEDGDLDPAVNVDRTEALRGDLEAHGLTFKPLRGTFNGDPEASFLVVDRATPAADTIRETVGCLARWYDQRCYLERHPDGRASWCYLDGRADVDAGRFVPDTPRASEDYTFDPATGEFWVLR